MRKFFITAGLLLLLALVLVTGLALRQPGQYQVQRSTTIAAPPQRVFALLDDLHAFNRWSPWVRLEPTVQLRYSGPPSGVGAAYTWQGDKTGAGGMTIRESVAPQRVAMDLHFLKPFESRSTVLFSIEPAGTASRVTWAMSGPMPFISKLMAVFADMDRMIGPDFEQGLANLKAMAEGG